MSDQWTSVDGSTPTFLSWRASEPNQPIDSEDDCGRLHRADQKSWAWKDVECKNSYAFICEKGNTLTILIEYGPYTQG